MNANVLTLTDENFEAEVFASDLPVVIDFWAAWCGSCLVLSPRVEALAIDFGDRAKVAKLNIDQYPEIATRFGIQAIPTLLYIQDGQIVDRAVGVEPQTVLAAKLETLLQPHNTQQAA